MLTRTYEEESGGGYSGDLTQFHREDSLKDTAWVTTAGGGYLPQLV